MKTYKHKTTGYKAESEGSNPYSYVVHMPDRIITLPAQLVEDPGFGWVLQKDYEILGYDISGMADLGDKPIINSVKRLPDGEVVSIGEERRSELLSGIVTGFEEREESIWVYIHGIGINLNFIQKSRKPEKDYEILKYFGIGAKIHSVKRLSDGEVFSVNDLHASEYIGPYKINKILQENGEIWFDHDAGATRIDKAKKVTRKPILTSEDGVELFEGDEYWWIHKDAKNCNIHSGTFTGTHPVGKNVLYFSTREAAEKYRMNYARVLCMEEVLTIIFKSHTPVTELKNLVKSRLK